MSLKVGVIGCGGMGRDHIKRITERTQGAEVVAVSDVFEEGAKFGAEIAGNGCKVYTDQIQLINDPDVEAVLVVSPGKAHLDALLECIKVGKRVFCEKPLAATADECKQIMDAEVASGKHLIQLGFMRRYHKGYEQLKAAIDSKKYGEPLIVYSTHRNPDVPDTYDTPMAVYDTCIHDIDICHWLVNDDYDSVQVIMPKKTKRAHSNLQDPQIMIMHTKSGIYVHAEIFVACKFGYDINCQVLTEEASLKMGMPIGVEIKHDAVFEKEVSTDCFVLFKDAYDAEIQNWVDCAAKGVIEGPNCWDGYQAAVTSDALMKSQKTLAVEKVESVDRPAFYN